jgi:integrase
VLYHELQAQPEDNKEPGGNSVNHVELGESLAVCRAQPVRRPGAAEVGGPEQPSFSQSDVHKIIAAIDPHYRPALWLLVQTGIRRGELCALNVGDVDFANNKIYVRRSRAGKFITNTKSKKPRDFPISSKLAERLKEMASSRSADDPMFLTKVIVTSQKRKVIGGKRLHPDNFYARVVKPVVIALGLKGGLHAFRHGNATAQDAMNVPMKTRMDRLGHVNSRTTMGYTHSVTEEARRVPEMLDEYFAIESMAIH